jgi:two-component sensor histidine kinase
MQVISSLLNLQIIRSKDDQVKKALMDCQGRIFSMASTHEMLYTSESLTVINCQSYISLLTWQILNVCNASHQDLHRVKMRVDAKGVELGIQQATTLGLIINEILSNALKYAFPQNMPGRIMICLKLCKNDVVELVVSDNGIGIPEDVDWRNCKTLGLNLIVLLAENQLGGTISLDRKEGTCFTVKFKRENNQPESMMK